jgi:hypothetical protein
VSNQKDGNSRAEVPETADPARVDGAFWGSLY